MSVAPQLLAILVCPKCKGELAYREAESALDCPRCRLRYPVREDIPVDSLPPALRRAREEIVEEPMDWRLLQERGSDWMRYWDERVRGRG